MIVARLRRLRIQRVGETDDRDDGGGMALARIYRLTAYDASYLALAIREDCTPASLRSG